MPPDLVGYLFRVLASWGSLMWINSLITNGHGFLTQKLISPNRIGKKI
jgi:hypothetical protein